MKNWTRFTSIASQWAVGILLTVLIGGWLDKKWRPSAAKPLFQWLLPFVFIAGFLIKLIKDTNQHDEQ